MKNKDKKVRINLLITQEEYAELQKNKENRGILITKMLRDEIAFLIHYYNNWSS